MRIICTCLFAAPPLHSHSNGLQLQSLLRHHPRAQRPPSQLSLVLTQTGLLSNPMFEQRLELQQRTRRGSQLGIGG